MFVAAVLSSVPVLSGCGYALHSGRGAPDDVTVVRVAVTPSGCRPVPGTVAAGAVQIVVTNLDAPTVSEVEVRTGDFSRVVAEHENLVEGLSATFELHLDQGRYIVNCPGAADARWPLVVPP